MTLRDLRKQNKKTVAEIAKVLKSSISTIYGYEQGVRRLGLEEILALAKEYDCSAEEIILAQLKSVYVGKTDKVI